MKTLKTVQFMATLALLFSSCSGEDVHSVAFTPDGSKLICGTRDMSLLGEYGQIKVLDVIKGKGFGSILMHRKHPVFSTVSHDGRFITGTFDGIEESEIIPEALRGSVTGIKIFELKTGRLIQFIRSDSTLIRDSVHWSPSGNHIIFSDNNVIKIYSITDSGHYYKLTGHDNYISAIAVSRTNMLASSSAYGDNGSRLLIHNLKKGELINKFILKNFKVSKILFNNDGTLLAMLNYHCDTLKIVKSKNGAEVRALNLDIATDRIAISNDWKYLASGGRGVALWDFSKGKKIIKFDINFSLYGALDFSPDNALLAVGSGTTSIFPLNFSGYESIILISIHEGKIVNRIKY